MKLWQQRVSVFSEMPIPDWRSLRPRPQVSRRLKPRLRVTRHAERLARGRLAELRFWKSIQMFPYQSNSQNFFKFYDKLNEGQVLTSKKILLSVITKVIRIIYSNIFVWCLSLSSPSELHTGTSRV